MRKRLVATFGVVAAVALAGGAWAQSTMGGDARAQACGAGMGKTKAAFAVAHASEVRTQHLPHMLPAPELDSDQSPAYVVVFDGPVSLPTTGFVAKSDHAPYENVICVLVNDTPTYYADVDTTDLTP
jgi:hypothetical protein